MANKDPFEGAVWDDPFKGATWDEIPAPIAQPKGMVGRVAGAALQGAKSEALSGIAKPLALAASTPFILADKIRGAISGDQSDTRAQDTFFRNVVAPITEKAESLAPTAEQSASVPESVAYGLGGLLTDLPIIALTGGKAGAPALAANAGRVAKAISAGVRGAEAIAPIAAGHAISQAETAASQGIDLPTAYASGATAGATTLAGGIVPLAMRGGLLTRAATGAVSGAATGEAGRLAQNAVLSEYQNQQTPFSGVNLASQAATGALLGSVLGPRPVRETARPTETAPVAAEETKTPPLLENRPETLISFPDGTVGTVRDAEAYVQSLPENQQAEARASLFGMAPQNAVPDILARAGAAENAPVDEPIRAANQKHAQDIATIRDAGEQPTGNPETDAARAFELHNDLPEPPPAPREPIPPSAEPVSERTNTQVQDALLDAQRQAGTGRAAIQAAFEQAEAQRAAAKERELTAIQNIARGEQQAEAAARGEVPAGTETMAAPVQEFQGRLNQSLPEGTDKLPPRIRQEVAKAVSGKQTYTEQLDALTALRDGKKETTVSFAVLDKMVKDLRPEPTPAPEAAIEPAPQAAPEAAPAPEAKPATARENAQAAADRLDATVAELNARDRAGQLADNERPRLQEAQDLRRTLSRVLETKTAGDEYLNDLIKFADNTATQAAYDAQGPRLAFKAESPEAVHPGLENLMRSTENVQDVLGFLKDNGSEQWVKDLADKLSQFGLDTRIKMSADKNGFEPGTVGAYNPRLREARFFDGGASEHTTLHEMVHAAMYDQMDQASRIFAPQNQTEAAKVSAFRGLDDLRKEALKRASAKDHYGLTDVHEFVAELNTNPKFQEFLSQKSLWQKVVTAVRKMLGMPADAQTQLEKAMSLQGEFFGKEQYEAAQRTREAIQKFDATPAGAAEVTDNVLRNIAKTADEDKPKISLASISRKAFEKMLPWETTEYIVDRAKATPEFGPSGFAAAAEGYERAYKTRNIANEYAEQAPVKFGTDLEHKFASMKPDDARATNRLMSEIGTGSSIGGFDPSMNFDQNKKARPGLAESNKAYINEINRKFQQLKSKDPASAQAIIDGAKVNRKGYVLDQATIMSNLMRAAGDNVRRLEADLQLMDPADAATARAQARLQALTKEAQFAVDHAEGLDFMAKDLKTAKNSRPEIHIDGASDVLDQRVRKAFADAKALPEDSTLRQQLSEIEGAYINQIENPYYHAGRSGDYFVNFAYRNMDQATWDRMQESLSSTNKVLGDFNNQNHAFMRFDSLEEAQAAYRKLRAAAGDKFVGPDSASGKLAEGGVISNNSGISAAMRSALATLHDNVDAAGLTGEQATAMKDALTRKFLSMLPETSTRLAQTKRMGVPGYDGDFLGSFAKRAGGGVRDTANIYAMRGFSDAFSGMDQAIDQMARTGDPEMQSRAQFISDEIKKRYYNGMQPIDNSVVNLLNTLGHSFYLAASPAYLIRSMAQPWHRAVPVLGARYGFISSAKEMAGATGDAVKIMANSIRDGWSQAGLRGALDADLNLDGTNLSPTDKAFVQEMHDRGILKLGQARQLQNLVVGGNLHLRDASRAAAMTIQYSDMVNRLVTGLAAFRLAQKQGGRSVEANTDYALKAVNKAMDNFEADNTARAIGKHGFAGKVTPLFTAFMNYNFQTMQQIARTVHDGMFNRDTSPEGLQRSREAKRELAGLMGTTAMISGALGLPFVSAFAGVYNMLAQDDDNPSDIRLDTRNWLADTFGADVGNVLSHGVGYGLGVDTASFGLQDLLPGSQFLADRRLFKDKIADNAKGWWGPSINAGLDLGEGLIKLSDGQYVKGVEQMLPSGLKGAWKAYQINNYGYTDAKGNPIPVEATPWDVAIQATGLRPASRALASEASNYFNVNQSRLDARRALILDNFFKGIDRKDQALTNTALEQVRAFNQANPTQPISDLNSVVRQRYQQRALGAAAGAGVPVSRRNFPSLEQDVRFTGNTLPSF